MDRSDEAPLIHLHWALIFSLVFMVLLGEPGRVAPATHLLYVGVVLASGLALPRLSFPNPRTLCAALIGFDTMSALVGLAIGNSTSQDLMVAYFLCIVMASFGDSHERLAGVAMMLTGVYALSRFQGIDVLHSPALLLHLPFLFVVTVFYGYVMQRFRGEVQYRRIFETNPRPTWVYDVKSLAFLEVNQAAVCQYGYSRDEFRGMTIMDIRPSEDVPALLSAVSSAEPSFTTSGEFRHTRKDGSILDVDVTSTAMLFNGRRARLVTATNITDRKRAASDLQAALRKAEESDRLKSAFLGAMSHEIRTPINVILGYNELIRERLQPNGDGANASLLDAVRRASERLTHTIHGILDLAQLQSGAFEVRPTSLELAKLIEAEIEAFRTVAASKGLSLSCQIDEPQAAVYCDEYCFVGALRNLLDNAIKFTAQGSISVRLFRGHEGLVSLEVRDSGIGMSESYLSRLFQPFSQEEVGNARPFEGAGVGLAVAKGLLELNGVQLSVESLKGRGATFRICFAAT